MERNKKIGTITIVAALLFAVAAVAFSANPCNAEAPLLTVLLHCVRVELPNYMAIGEYSHEAYVLTKYALLISAVIASIGFLWLKGALPLPGGSKSEEDSGTSPAPRNDA